MASFVEESIMEDLLHYVIPYVCKLLNSWINQHINSYGRRLEQLHKESSSQKKYSELKRYKMSGK